MTLVKEDTKVLTVTLNPDGFEDDFFTTKDNALSSLSSDILNSGLLPIGFINCDGRGNFPVILNSVSKSISVTTNQFTSKLKNPFKKSLTEGVKIISAGLIAGVTKDPNPLTTTLSIDYDKNNLFWKGIDGFLTLSGNLINLFRFTFISAEVVTVGAYLKSYSTVDKAGSSNLRTASIVLENLQNPNGAQALLGIGAIVASIESIT